MHERRKRLDYDRSDRDGWDEVAVANVDVEDTCAGIQQRLVVSAAGRGDERGVVAGRDDERGLDAPAGRGAGRGVRRAKRYPAKP